jgi:hypothetical protein
LKQILHTADGIKDKPMPDGTEETFTRAEMEAAVAAMRNQCAEVAGDIAHHSYTLARTVEGDVADHVMNCVDALPADDTALKLAIARAVRDEAKWWFKDTNGSKERLAAANAEVERLRAVKSEQERE